MKPSQESPVATAVAKSPSSHRLLGIAAAAVTVLGVWAATALHADAAVPTPSGWTQIFADDFTGTAGDRVGSGWRYDVGTSYPGGPGPGFGTGEVEVMTDSTDNVALDGAGNLEITALRNGTGWTSGRIETNRDDFQPPANGTLRVEARLRMPDLAGAAARGYWPAFWMLGAPFRGNWWNWPSIGEIDIMENVQGLNRQWGTMHCGTSVGGPCNEKSGVGASVPCVGTTCQAGFHTYAVEWDRSISPQEIRWYLDGVQFHRVSAGQMDAATWKAATDHGYFIILNLAIGGEFPATLGGGPDAATASGGSLLVDYVAAWTADGPNDPPPTTTPPTSPATSRPTTFPPTSSPPTSVPPTSSQSTSGPSTGGPSTGGPSTGQPPATDPPSSGGRDAYAINQAESFDGQRGIRTESTADVEGGTDITGIANGDWVRYEDVDFGTTPATQFVARVASGATGGVSGLVEVRLDSRSRPPVGSFAIADTGGWQRWRTVPANMDPVTGTHDVYLTFTSGQPAEYLSMNWLRFGH